MVDIGDQQREEDVQLLDLFCQNGVLIDNAIYQLIGAQVLLTDLTDIDALLGGRAYGDKLTSYNNNYGLRRGSQPRLFPSQSRSC